MNPSPSMQTGAGGAGEAVIRTEGLGKTYRNVLALRSLSLQVPKHSIFGFLGPNGAGKTTTIKLLLGLTRPTAGSRQPRPHGPAGRPRGDGAAAQAHHHLLLDPHPR